MVPSVFYPGLLVIYRLLQVANYHDGVHLWRYLERSGLCSSDITSMSSGCTEEGTPVP